MTDIVVRVVDSGDPLAAPCWDTVWNTELAAGDWAVADEDDPEGNSGGLRAQQPLLTAIMMCLLTDIRRPEYLSAPDDSQDRRGWHGDCFDLVTEDGERPMGSLLWTLARSALDDQTELLAKHYASQALQTLIDQRIVGSFVIEAESDKAAGTLKLAIQANAPDGQVILADTFSIF